MSIAPFGRCHEAVMASVAKHPFSESLRPHKIGYTKIEEADDRSHELKPEVEAGLLSQAQAERNDAVGLPILSMWNELCVWKRQEVRHSEERAASL